MNAIQKIRLASCLLAAAVLSGCGNKAKEEPKIVTQVAAKVNAEEITVSQVNNVLGRTPNIPPEAADRAKREILEKLIDQHLAKQAALEKQLDRTPQTMQAIEAARNEILARAYLQQIASAQTQPSPEAVKKYYNDHPELFAERKIFQIEEILVPDAGGLADQVQAQIGKSRSLQDVAAWLNAQKVKFTANSGVRGAESIPLSLLPQLQSMKAGEIKMLKSGNNLQIFRLVAMRSQPVDEARATPSIQRFLFNQKAAEIVAAEMKRLKDKADITFMGEFVEDAATTAAKAKQKAEAEARAQKEAMAKSIEETEAQARAEELSRARKAAEAEAQAAAQAKAEELTKARRAVEAQARAEAEARAKDASKGTSLQQESIEKGLRGIK